VRGSCIFTHPILTHLDNACHQLIVAPLTQCNTQCNAVQLTTPHCGNLRSQFMVQGCQDPEDAINRRSFSAKEPLIVRLFCGKLTYNDKASYGSSPSCSYPSPPCSYSILPNNAPAVHCHTMLHRATLHHTVPHIIVATSRYIAPHCHTAPYCPHMGWLR